MRVGVCVLSIGVLAMASAARADRVAPRLPNVSGVVPIDGSDIPTNARVVFFGNVDPSELTFTRVRADQSREVLDFDSSLPGVFIVDPGLIAVGDVVAIEPGCAACTSFVTYHAPFSDDVTPPVLEGGTEIEPGVVTGFESSSRLFTQPPPGYAVTFTVPRVRDDSGPVFIDFKPDDGEEVFTPAGGSDPPAGGEVGVDAGDTRVNVFIEGAERRTVCADVLAVDVAGNETPFPDRACVDLVPPPSLHGSCASTPASTTSLAVLALALLRRRRRR